MPLNKTKGEGGWDFAVTAASLLSPASHRMTAARQNQARAGSPACCAPAADWFAGAVRPLVGLPACPGRWLTRWPVTLVAGTTRYPAPLRCCPRTARGEAAAEPPIRVWKNWLITIINRAFSKPCICGIEKLIKKRNTQFNTPCAPSDRWHHPPPPNSPNDPPHTQKVVPGVYYVNLT